MKKIFLVAATAAIAMSSCSKNEVLEMSTPNENPDAIGLNVSSFVTKSTEVTTSSLNASGTTLTLYANDDEFGTDGVLKFSCDGSSWTAEGGETWKNISFPTNVFSMYPLTNVTVNSAAGTSPYTVKGDVAGQEDLVYFSQTLNAIPTAGTISAVYKHALSRVKMQDITDYSKTDVKYKNVSLKGFDGAANATMTPATNTLSWSGNVDAQSESYLYDLEDAANATNDMYIIPQATPSFTYDGSTLPTSGVATECIIAKAGTPNIPIAGCESATDFISLNPEVKSVKKGGVDYTGKMYVKAIFALNAVNFEIEKYYNLQLNFGGAGVYYADDKYYAEDGTELVIDGTPTVPGPPVTGEPINPDENTAIGLTVIVNAWPTAEDK